MPLYTVYHPPDLSSRVRSQIATVVTDSHVSATGAPAFLAKVIFIPLESTSFYSGGNKEEQLLQIVGVIRAGWSREERQKLLLSIYEGIKVHRYDVEIHPQLLWIFSIMSRNATTIESCREVITLKITAPFLASPVEEPISTL